MFFSDNNNSLSRAKKALDNLVLDKEILSDPFFLGKSFANEPFRNIENNFGPVFATNFIDQPIKKWVGPIKSTFGHHLVFINNINPGYTPDIKDVFRQVEVDYLQHKRDQIVIENFYSKNIPLCGVLGGGYNKSFEKLIELHSMLHKNCAEYF